MKNPIIFVIFIFLSIPAFTQTPNISYQKIIGGNKIDAGKGMVQLPNGDLVICASSDSDISGDKTENGFGGNDYWVFKITATGNLVWQITLGGVNDDIPNAIVQTNDGGFLINGNSKSSISGNKTSPSFGGWDAWVVKLSSTGQIEWQKSFGGDSEDFGLALSKLSNGNYLIANTSNSNISGNKSVLSKGGTDFWPIVVDLNGNIVDQYVYGGSGNEVLKSVIGLGGSKLVLSGSSNSDISGDKGQDSYGSNDFWTIIIDSSGSMITSSTEGGDASEIANVIFNRGDNELMLFGASSSDVSGSKTIGEFGFGDYWCVVLDSNLNRKWESVFGGSGIEGKFNDIGGVYYDAIKQYVVGGSSLSEVSGNKTIAAFDVGYGDLWMVGFDTLGVKQFEFVAGGDGEELFGQIIESNNNTLYVVGLSWSTISGNKTVPNVGDGDVWLIELDFNVGIEKNPVENLLEVYPNPVKTILKYNLPMVVNSSNVSLTDVSGKVVFKDKLNGVKESQIDVSSLQLGVYVLTIISNEFKYSRKIVID